MSGSPDEKLKSLEEAVRRHGRLIPDLDQRLTFLEKQTSQINDRLVKSNVCMAVALITVMDVLKRILAIYTALASLTSTIYSTIYSLLLQRQPAMMSFHTSEVRKLLQGFLREHASLINRILHPDLSEVLDKCVKTMESPDTETINIFEMVKTTIEEITTDLLKHVTNSILAVYNSLATFDSTFENPETFLQDLVTHGGPQLLYYVDDQEMLRNYGNEGVNLLKNYRKVMGQS